MSADEVQALRELLDHLTRELADREAALPAHSVRPGQLIAIEELEDRIRDLREKINRAESGG